MSNIISAARITAVYRDRYICIAGELELSARLKTSAFDETSFFPTVGDIVELECIPTGDSMIQSVQPRKSVFVRSDPDPRAVREQAVAANFDFVFIVQSMNQNFNIRRLERYLTAAWQSGATPVVILTKSDLCDRPGDFLADAMEVAMGCDVYAVSALSGDGMDGLAQYTADGVVSVLLGSSGVGKSTLLNALAGETLMETRAIREDDARGRHTTTHRQMFRLPSGGYVIDTPGMRSLGLWQGGDALGETFRDVERVLERGCRFSDCRHVSEPDCAVRAALRSGELDAGRWERYQKLLIETKRTARKAARLTEKQPEREERKPRGDWRREIEFDD